MSIGRQTVLQIGLPPMLVSILSIGPGPRVIIFLYPFKDSFFLIFWVAIVPELYDRLAVPKKKKMDGMNEQTDIHTQFLTN